MYVGVISMFNISNLKICLAIESSGFQNRIRKKTTFYVCLLTFNFLKKKKVNKEVGYEHYLTN